MAIGSQMHAQLNRPLSQPHLPGVQLVLSCAAAAACCLAACCTTQRQQVVGWELSERTA